MASIEVTKALLFDPLPLAYLIESRAGMYLDHTKVNENSNIVNVGNVSYSNVIIKKTEEFENKFPHVGLEIIKTYVNLLLTHKSGWLKFGSCDPRDSICNYILPEFRNDDAVYDIIASILVEVRNDVNDFIGKDDFVMHFVRMRRTDVVIEKTIDFRIFDWNRRMAEGEWS